VGWRANLVVGWDSWLVQWAIDNNVDVIDTTQLLHVSHLTADDGNMAGWNTARPVREKQHVCAIATCHSHVLATCHSHVP
jgi:hypothetical protein